MSYGRELWVEVRPIPTECVPWVIRKVKCATSVLMWNGCIFSQGLTHARKDVLDAAVEALGGARPQ